MKEKMSNWKLQPVNRGNTILTFFLFLMLASPAFGQCSSRVWESTTYPQGPAKFQSLLPAGMTERFSVNLFGNDWLVVYARPGVHTSQDPQDGGFLLVRDHRVLVSQSLMQVPAWKKFARDIGPENLPAFNVFAAQVCHGHGRIVVLGFAACCSTASAVLYMIAEPNGDNYRLTTLPMVGGGKLEIAASDPVRLSLWDELGDGACDGCLQHFNISEYKMEDGAPVLIRKQRASTKHKPGDFDAHRIVLVPASQ
ncbi:MAG: hypothetical protein WA634_15075 [Silvibacterium sp.]